MLRALKYGRFFSPGTIRLSRPRSTIELLAREKRANGLNGRREIAEIYVYALYTCTYIYLISLSLSLYRGVSRLCAETRTSTNIYHRCLSASEKPFPPLLEALDLLLHATSCDSATHSPTRRLSPPHANRQRPSIMSPHILSVERRKMTGVG